MTLAAFITTCFVIGGISATYLLRQRHREGAQLMLKLSVCFAAITVPLQVVVGDLHGLKVREHQPVKLAAIEGHWETRARRAADPVRVAGPGARDESLRGERAEARQPDPHARHRRRDRGLEGSRAASCGRRSRRCSSRFRVMVGIGIADALARRRGRRCSGDAAGLFESKRRVARVDVDDARGLRRRARRLVHDGDRAPAVRRLRPACARRKLRPPSTPAACSRR